MLHTNLKLDRGRSAVPVSYLNRVDKDVLSTLARTQPLKPEKSRRPLFMLASLVVIATVCGIGFGTYYLFIPQGKITTTTDNGQGSRLIEIQGHTRNIPLERNYIWVAVEILSLNFCWPKRRIYTRNTKFQVKFHENGPNPSVKVSLYALNRDHHLVIGKWREEVKLFGQEEGLLLLPKEYRLDSVEIDVGL